MSDGTNFVIVAYDTIADEMGVLGGRMGINLALGATSPLPLDVLKYNLSTDRTFQPDRSAGALQA